MTPSQNPLLSDLLEESTADAIAFGNLPSYKKAQKAKPPPEPVLITQWTSIGYFAHIDRTTCTACGSVHSNLVGVFLREHATLTPSTIRSTRISLRAFRDLSIKPALEVIETPTELCASCVDLLP